MKRWLCLALAISMTIALVGCSAPNSANTPPATSPTDITSTPVPSESSEPPSEYTFRSTVWGMTREEVIVAEGDDYSAAASSLEKALVYYDREFAGLPCDLMYEFDNNTLVAAHYIFNTYHKDNNLYIDDYNNLKSVLTEMYGEILGDDIVWTNSLWKDDPSNYGLSLALGYHSYVASWALEDDGWVTLTLWGRNNNIHLSIEYSD